MRSGATLWEKRGCMDLVRLRPMQVAAPRPNIALRLLQNSHQPLQRGRIEPMRNFDPSPVGQLRRKHPVRRNLRRCRLMLPCAAKLAILIQGRGG